MPSTQAGICTIRTPLGGRQPRVKQLSGSEGVSSLFNLRLELESEDRAIDFAALVGKTVNLKLDLGEGAERYFSGVVARFAQGASGATHTTYVAEIVPWLWFLTRRADCRIFQNQTVQDIVNTIFRELGFSDYEWKLSGPYAPWLFCVQYRESDFAFVSRLLEQEGIFYYFRHEASRHVLVMGDASARAPSVPGGADLRYLPSGDGLGGADITQWDVTQELQPGAVALNDYNFMDPATSLLVRADTAVAVGGNSRFEVFDYPGEYVKLGAETEGKLEKGEAWARLRMQAQDATAITVAGSSTCGTFAAGHQFTLNGHYRA